MKLKNDILKDSINFYSKGNSSKETSDFIYQKYGVKISSNGIGKRLKNFGIIRDNITAVKISKRKHLPIKEIIRLYTEELVSLKKLAKMFGSTKSTIHKILAENGIKIRNNYEGIKLTNLKYPKIPFNGTLEEKAYLTGLIKGDITPMKKSKFTLRLTSSSSRKAFVDLFKNTFGKYGTTYIYVVKDKLSKYSWRMTADLDAQSFNFLLMLQIDLNRQFMFSYLAGLIDSDGSIFIRKAGKYFQYILRIYNEDLYSLQTIRKFLEKEGFNPHLQLFSKKDDIRESKDRIVRYNNDYYAIELSQRENVKRILSLIPLRHTEKLLWINKIKEIEEKKLKFWFDIEREVKSLRKYIDMKYQESLNEAEKSFIKK